MHRHPFLRPSHNLLLLNVSQIRIEPGDHGRLHHRPTIRVGVQHVDVQRRIGLDETGSPELAQQLHPGLEYHLHRGTADKVIPAEAFLAVFYFGILPHLEGGDERDVIAEGVRREGLAFGLGHGLLSLSGQQEGIPERKWGFKIS